MSYDGDGALDPELMKVQPQTLADEVSEIGLKLLDLSMRIPTDAEAPEPPPSFREYLRWRSVELDKVVQCITLLMSRGVPATDGESAADIAVRLLKAAYPHGEIESKLRWLKAAYPQGEVASKLCVALEQILELEQKAKNANDLAATYWDRIEELDRRITQAVVRIKAMMKIHDRGPTWSDLTLLFSELGGEP